MLAKSFLIREGFDDSKIQHKEIKEKIQKCIKDKSYRANIAMLSFRDQLYGNRIKADYEQQHINQSEYKDSLEALETIKGVFDEIKEDKQKRNSKQHYHIYAG